MALRRGPGSGNNRIFPYAPSDNSYEVGFSPSEAQDAPRVTRTLPPNETRDVPRNTEIRVYFDRRMLLVKLLSLKKA